MINLIAKRVDFSYINKDELQHLKRIIRMWTESNTLVEYKTLDSICKRNPSLKYVRESSVYRVLKIPNERVGEINTAQDVFNKFLYKSNKPESYSLSEKGVLDFIQNGDSVTPFHKLFLFRISLRDSDVLCNVDACLRYFVPQDNKFDKNLLKEREILCYPNTLMRSAKQGRCFLVGYGHGEIGTPFKLLETPQLVKV